MIVLINPLKISVQVSEHEETWRENMIAKIFLCIQLTSCIYLLLSFFFFLIIDSIEDKTIQPCSWLDFRHKIFTHPLSGVHFSSLKCPVLPPLQCTFFKVIFFFFFTNSESAYALIGVAKFCGTLFYFLCLSVLRGR